MDRNQQTANEISVVGGSAAGFFTGYLLARGNRRVCVYERAEQLDPTPRTLIVTSKMRELLGSVGENAVVNEVRRFELFADGRMATVALRRPDLIVERSTLISDMAQQAQRFGARILLGRKFLSLEPNHSGLTVLMTRSAGGGTEEVHSNTVVGADGAASQVARAAGWPPQNVVPLVQAIVQWPRNLCPNSVRVWFAPGDTPYFYWLVPESPKRGVLGLIGEDGQKTRRCLEHFLEKQRLTPLGFQGAKVPLYTKWVPVHRRLGEGHVFLVGDAAGQVKVSTVGGIVTGLRGASGVAEAILNGGPGRELRALRRELDIHMLVRNGLCRFTQADYSRLLDLLNASAGDTLGLYSRDEAAKLLWHLCFSQPRLLVFGLRAILTNGFFPRNTSS